MGMKNYLNQSKSVNRNFTKLLNFSSHLPHFYDVSWLSVMKLCKVALNIKMKEPKTNPGPLKGKLQKGEFNYLSSYWDLDIKNILVPSIFN